jgi:predicted short-subunit dehydrogenase-like oxidoreductase (DUF2520 family)
MTIAFVGSGNMATHLLRCFKENGINVTGLFSRNLTTARELCNKYNIFLAEKITDLKADMIFLCVSDDAINEVSSCFHNSESIIVHTSGSIEMSAIASENKGVFYPLQTMTKNTSIDFGEVPIFITASSSFVFNKLSELANGVSHRVKSISDDQRQKLHLSAVLTNNFINHLVVKAKDFLEMNDLDYEMIVPLLKTSAEKLIVKPYNFQQTGPAKRGDDKVIEKHLTLLDNDIDLKNIYESITNSIKHHENNT